MGSWSPAKGASYLYIYRGPAMTEKEKIRVTRFSPTLYSYAIPHVGHGYNYMLNLIYAWKNNGAMYISVETHESIDGRPSARARQLRLWHKLNYPTGLIMMFDAFYPGLLFLLREKSDILSVSPLGSIVLMDAILGINTFIRGSDFSQNGLTVLHPNGAQVGLFSPEAYLDFSKVALTSVGIEDIELYFHPLLCVSGKKLSKSDSKKNVMSGNYLDDAIDKYGCLAFLLATCSWSGYGMPKNAQELFDVMHEFDFDTLRDLEDIEFGETVLEGAKEATLSGGFEPEFFVEKIAVPVVTRTVEHFQSIRQDREVGNG